MKSRITVFMLGVFLIAAVGRSFFQEEAATGPNMTQAAKQYLATLSAEQLELSQMEFETPQRIDWHFIPMDHRKGLQIRDMNEEQRQAALALLASSLSEVGYEKATKIMELESLLHELERERQGPIRDPERYYFTVFGDPEPEGKWGLSVEGHHLSLNFTLEDGQVTSSTPTFFAANPAIVHSEVAGVDLPEGTRVLANEELLAFQLVNSLDDEQKEKGIIADQAPREIRAPGEPQPPTDPPEGIPYEELNDEQRRTMRRLVSEYARNLPRDVFTERMDAIREAGPEKVHFAWAGATEPGIGHYYRIQGPTFLIEFVNTQPDAEGNRANHIHSVWRDMRGDFAIAMDAD